MGKIFNKGLDKDDQKEGLFIRLKNIENVQKKKHQNNNIESKPLNVFDYLKSSSQEVKYLMDEIEDADNYTEIHELVFIGSNKEKFNFNIFKMPLNFLSAIYNGKISFKEAEISIKK